MLIPQLRQPLHLAAAVVISLVLLVVLPGAEAELIDIDPEVYHVVNAHNQARRAVRDASDMMEMVWDERLAERAARWSDRCLYQRPPESEGVQSNFGTQRGYVYGGRAVHQMVSTILNHWISGQSRFRYSKDCGRACTYVNMIYARANRIGCALSTCATLQSSRQRLQHASMFVCFYSPKVDLKDSFPYRQGEQCSECWVSGASECKDNLCYSPGSDAVMNRYRSIATADPRPRPGTRTQGDLTRNEEQNLLSAHNEVRRPSSRVDAPRATMQWDPHLESYAKWVVSCDADFPGPRYAYTNFYRVVQGSDISSVVDEWLLEGNNTHLYMEHGCRTPLDSSRCNHWTNIREQSLNSMACSAKNCDDATRQLVCIYDNRMERETYQRSHLRRQTTNRSRIPFNPGSGPRYTPNPRYRPTNRPLRRFTPTPRPRTTNREGKTEEEIYYENRNAAIRRAQEEARRRSEDEARRRALRTEELRRNSRVGTAASSSGPGDRNAEALRADYERRKKEWEEQNARINEQNRRQRQRNRNERPATQALRELIETAEDEKTRREYQELLEYSQY